MKTYLICNQTVGAQAKRLFKRPQDVTILSAGHQDINRYPALFTDPNPKVIGVDPGLLEWQLPTASLKRIQNLKGVATKSSWAHWIDLKYCSQNRIPVTNCPGANSQSVAEYALLQMLALARRLPLQFNDAFKVHLQPDHQGTELMGKTLGIIGYGHIGSRLAKMGAGLGMKVIYFNRYSKPSPFKRHTLNYVLKHADFVVNSLETCKATEGILNQKRLSLMKPTAYFVSVLGGMGFKVQDDTFLVKMVNTGKLSGFSVENEHNGPFPDHFDGNIFVPGAYAWFTHEANNRTIKTWTDSLQSLATPKPLHRVN